MDNEFNYTTGPDNDFIPNEDIDTEEIIKKQLQVSISQSGLGTNIGGVNNSNDNIARLNMTPSPAEHIIIHDFNNNDPVDDIIDAIHKYIKENNNSVHILSSFFKRISEAFEDNHEVKQEILQNSILEFINKYDTIDQMVVVNFMSFLDRITRNYNFNNVRRTSLNLNGLPVL